MQYYHFYYSLGFHKFKAAFHIIFVKNDPKSIIEQVHYQPLSKSPYLSLIYKGKLVIMFSVLSGLGRSSLCHCITAVYKKKFLTVNVKQNQKHIYYLM